MNTTQWEVNGKIFKKDECIQYVDKNDELQDGYLRKVFLDKNKVHIFGYAPNLEEGLCVITTLDKLRKITEVQA